MKKSSKKYYVVWAGRKTGIFEDWATCKSHVDGFPGAKFKSFCSLAQAECAFGSPMAKSTSVILPNAKKAASGSQRSQQISLIDKLDDRLISDINVDTKIYADGACNPNPGLSGSGVAIFRNEAIEELWFGSYLADGTNNTAELSALWYAICVATNELAAGRSAAIFSDSKYSINCITKWASSWEKKGWVKKGGEIKNLDLIKGIHAIYSTIKDKVDIHHVNGHVGILGNELADRMSLLAIENENNGWALYQEIIDIPAILSIRPD